MNKRIQFLSHFVDSLVDSYRPDILPLAVLRISFALHVLFLPVDYEWVARVPSEFFHAPPGFFAFINEPPSLGTLTTIEFARSVFALAVLVGWKTRLCSVGLGITLVLGSGFTHSFGKVDHFILFELLPIFMAFVGWGGRLSVDSRRHLIFRGHGLPLLLWAITVGFALFTAALPKALQGWLDPQREASRGFIAKDIADGYKTGPMADFLISINSSFFWKSLDYMTILAEASVLFAVLIPALYRVSIVVITIFHIGVYLSLGIDFSQYFFIYAVFFAFPIRNWFKFSTRQPISCGTQNTHPVSDGANITVNPGIRG
ncbi:hypothetical protein [Kocuria rosea]|uniref:hypothetical protein n=1 Tax=Kocuria rosea TaxID=1275 RepID=UPI00126A2A6F|nr:hypothetical protein [Kocuria polaris]